jgi:hypothetical protein
MKRFFALVLALCLVSSFVGCTEKTEVKSERTVTTPDGETTTTETETIERSGENPPPVEN